MSCTQSTKRCDKTPRNGILYVPPCCRQHIKDLFDTVIDVFEENRMTYWLDYGTLLGAVRTGDFIPHDDDADFSIYEQDKDLFLDKLRVKAEQKGYILRSAFDGNGAQLYVSDTNKLHVDIFYWYKDKDVMRRRFYVRGTDDNKGKDFPALWIEPLGRMVMSGRNCLVPNNPENFCEFRYGKFWRRPMRIFQFNNTPNKNAKKLY